MSEIQKISLIQLRKSMISFLCMVFAVFFLCPVHAYPLENNLEYKVKAAYLYNLTKFINWPESVLSNTENDSLNICILGDDPFGYAIDLLTNKTSQGYRVAVEYIQNVNSATQCHVVFVTKSKENHVKNILKELSNEKILTISDIDNFAQEGGCISLGILKGKVRFNVNLQSAQNAGLKVSAKLLELAHEVIR